MLNTALDFNLTSIGLDATTKKESNPFVCLYCARDCGKLQRKLSAEASLLTLVQGSKDISTACTSSRAPCWPCLSLSPSLASISTVLPQQDLLHHLPHTHILCIHTLFPVRTPLAVFILLPWSNPGIRISSLQGPLTSDLT